MLNPPVRDTISTREVFRDTIVAAVAPTHPLARRKAIALKELVGFPLVLTERSFGLRQQTDRMFARYRIEPTISCVTNSLTLVKGIVSFNHQCTLLPRFAIAPEAAAKTLCAVPVKEFMSDPLVFCISTRAGRLLSPAAKAFADAVVKFCQRFRR